MLAVSFVARRFAATDTELFRAQSQKLLADGQHSIQPRLRHGDVDTVKAMALHQPVGSCTSKEHLGSWTN